MAIEWNDKSIKVRLVFTPTWICVMIADSVLGLLWIDEPLYLRSLIMIRAIFYAFQSCILINNVFCPRFNVINVWQHVPLIIGTIGVIVTMLMYCTSIVTCVIVVASNLHISLSKVIAIKIICCLNLLMLFMGTQLYFVTSYHVLINRDRSFEMLPIEYNDLDDK
eukprot:318547_1